MSEEMEHDTDKNGLSDGGETKSRLDAPPEAVLRAYASICGLDDAEAHLGGKEPYREPDE